MMFKVIKTNSRYYFRKNNKNILTLNGSLLEVKKKKHADLIIKQIKDKNKLNNPYSLINLTYYSCNLTFLDIEEIKSKILKVLQFDMVLFRCFEEKELKDLMNKKFNPLISKFKKEFKLDIILLESILDMNSCDNNSFKKFLDDFDNFNLTVFYKLSNLIKSVILCYFFIKNEINYNVLYKLSNLEYTYQQKRWGVVNEQEAVDRNFYDTLKNISFFFKNIS